MTRQLYRISLGICLLLLAVFAKAQDEEESPLPELKPLVEAWNTYINKSNTQDLHRLYAPKVNAYGKTVTSEACMASKKAWLDKNAGYKQTLDDDLQVRTVAEGIEVSFTKNTTLNGKTKAYKAYLVFDRETKLIVRESDLTTDTNLAKALQGKPLPSGTHCFIATGGIYPEVAVPTFYELVYQLELTGAKLKGQGSYYSWFSRSMYSLEIKGTILTDNSLNLEVTAFGPMYPDEENDKITWKEIRKFDGTTLIWAGGDENACREMQQTTCEE